MPAPMRNGLARAESVPRVRVLVDQVFSFPGSSRRGWNQPDRIRSPPTPNPILPRTAPCRRPGLFPFPEA